MSFNVQNFKSIVDSRGGIMRNNKFQVNIPSPRKLVNRLGKYERDIPFFCKAVPLPGIGLLTSDVYRYGYGPIERSPHGAVFNDAMLQFYVDGNNMVRSWFRSWIGAIANPSAPNGINSVNQATGASAYEFGYKEDYAVDLRITAFNPEGRAVIKIVMCDAFPNYVGETMQDWDDKGSNMILPVSFTYRDWYEEFADGTLTDLTMLVPSVEAAPTTTTTAANGFVGPRV